MPLLSLFLQKIVKIDRMQENVKNIGNQELVNNNFESLEIDAINMLEWRNW